jgi:hypothetical protein
MTRLTVLAVVPSDNTQRQPCTVDGVPFAVIGSSSEPFLAKVVMEWASGGRMEVEHWIDVCSFFFRVTHIQFSRSLTLATLQALSSVRNKFSM